MGFWNLFSAGDTVEKTTDALINTGDKLFYTDEEKADMKLKTTELHIELLQAYHPFKVTQRILAFWYSFLFGIAFIVGMIIAIANVVMKYKTPPDAKVKLLDLQPLIDVVSAFGLFGITITIVSFYFAGGTFESLKRTFGKK